MLSSLSCTIHPPGSGSEVPATWSVDSSPRNADMQSYRDAEMHRTKSMVPRFNSMLPYPLLRTLKTATVLITCHCHPFFSSQSLFFPRPSCLPSESFTALEKPRPMTFVLAALSLQEPVHSARVANSGPLPFLVHIAPFLVSYSSPHSLGVSWTQSGLSHLPAAWSPALSP